MNIEVLGNLRVKCTLTSEYLKSRWIDAGDLAYGSEAATALFRDIIEETNERFGIDFRARENHPVMIEAIPMGEGSLSVIISKAEDAEELDTRFSRFSPEHSAEGITPEYGDDADDIDDEDESIESGAPAFRERKRPSSKPSVRKNVTDFGKPFFETLEKEKERIREGGCIVTITFDMLGDLYDLASAGLGYSGDTSLYKNTSTGRYLLVIPVEGEEYGVAMNFAEAASEFGKARIVPKSGAAFLDKDHECLIGTGALEKIKAGK